MHLIRMSLHVVLMPRTSGHCVVQWRNRVLFAIYFQIKKIGFMSFRANRKLGYHFEADVGATATIGMVSRRSLGKPKRIYILVVGAGGARQVQGQTRQMSYRWDVSRSSYSQPLGPSSCRTFHERARS